MRVKYLFVSFLCAFLIISACRNVTEKQKGENKKSENKHSENEQVVDWSDVQVNDYLNEIDSSYVAREVNIFYESRNYKLAWIDNGKLSKNAYVLLDELKSSIHQGLKTENYSIFEIDKDLLNPDSDNYITLYSQAAKTDVLLSEAFLKYTTELLTGIITPDSLGIVWEIYPKKVNLPEYLGEALENNSIHEYLYKLGPYHESYYKLLDAYNYMSGINKEEWILPGYFPLLRPDDSSEYVLDLKVFLQASGDLIPPETEYMESAVFDQRLEYAVKQFQERHGLKADGLVGNMTLNEMNVPLEHSLNQLLVNIDRIRFLPSNLGRRYIIVNIPGYFLEYYENDKLKLTMNVVVGKIENYTPVLKDTMSYIVFNPDWNIPYSIATEEMLPIIKSDTTYLTRNNYVLLRGTYESTDTVNPGEVDWSEITPDDFPFSIIQKPGYDNALGRIKFMFPNNYSIYLHDIPADEDFQYEKRDFSHGCIRLEKPVELAKILLEGQLEPQEIQNILISEETEVVILEKKVLVHFMYKTAWVDNNYKLQFRRDIYDIDRKSISLLNSSP